MPHTLSGPRTAVLIGPYGSGKSTLFDALIAAAGGPARRGAAPRGGGTRIGHCVYLDEPWALVDCPGSVEFAHEADAALAMADIAILVCDPDPAKAQASARLLRRLEENELPALVFINRIDSFTGDVQQTAEALQKLTKRRLVLREVPIRSGEAVIVGEAAISGEAPDVTGEAP